MVRKPIYQIVFLGPQGSGKGTQAEKLAADFKIPVIATGQIYRDEAKKKTVLGDKVASCVNQGKLVPDDITNDLIIRRLGKKDCRRGFILDGYPRTLAQAEALAAITSLTQAISIDLPDREAIARIAGRLICNECGATYHLKANPPQEPGICDKCGAALLARKDDQAEAALRQRLAIYHEQIDPIVKFYENQGILCRIDGRQSIDEVYRAVKKVF
ncbi:MAG: nucleoside monophosphate kinase [Patescibacteria group bacterium]|jgi:adenylate kinase